MNKFFLFLLFPFILFSEINIVFIHIGNEVPSYVASALKQARLFNKDASIYLLGNKLALDKQKNIPLDTKKISLEDLEQSEMHKYFEAYSKHSKTTLEGFWQYTVERFFYLQEFVNQYSLENIFHLENDVMLYRDLRELLPVFLEYYPQIAATFDTDTRVIPGFIFFRNSSSLSELARHLSKAALNKNDMFSIASYRNSSRKERIDFLPIIFPEYTNIKPLINRLGYEPKNPANYWKNFEVFDSIFDAASIGQYLGGISPRNTKNIVPGFINETCVFNPSLLNYAWIKDDQGRKVPNINYNGRLIRINNLHIHSKNLNKFAS